MEHFIIQSLEITLEQLVSWATIGGVIVMIGALAIQIKGQKTELSETRKSRSAHIANDYDKRFMEDRFRIITRIISLAEINGKPIQITIGKPTNDSYLHIHEFDLDNYLSELETLGLFVIDGVISVKYAYELFGDQFNAVFEDNIISKYMKNIRITETDLWDNLYEAHKILCDYKDKKLKKSQ